MNELEWRRKIGLSLVLLGFWGNGSKNMGTVVTIMNMKGGVGKTTVAMHLGGVIARYKFGGKQR